MRILFLLSLVALLASGPLAWFHYQGRSGEADVSEFVVADGHARAKLGGENRWIGTAMSGWEQAAAEAPNDVEASLGQIRTSLHLSAVTVDQPDMGTLLHRTTDAYVAQRAAIDPDGRHMQAMIEDWFEQRLQFPYGTLKGFYARVAAAMFLAARGDDRGHRTLQEMTGLGDFWSEFFPYVRRYHPNWPAVEPLVRFYLERGSLPARVEAGMALIDYHVRFGVGKELYDRHLEDIRAAFKEIKTALRAGRLDPVTVRAGNRAFFGMAMLANLGFEEERELLEAVRRQYYPHHLDHIKMARAWAGLTPLSEFTPRSKAFVGFPQDVRLGYYDAVVHRLASFRRLPQGKRRMKEAEQAQCLEILTNGFDGPYPAIRIAAMRALLQFDEPAGKDAVRRAILERSQISVHAGILAEGVDLVPILFPALRSTEADVPALAAAGLLARDGPQALQK